MKAPTEYPAPRRDDREGVALLDDNHTPEPERFRPVTEPQTNPPRSRRLLVITVIVLAAERFRNDCIVRFHAFQGLYLFAAWLLVEWAVRPIFRAMPEPGFRVDHLLQAIILGLWIFMIIKANHEEAYALPVIGELAQRSAAER